MLFVGALRVVAQLGHAPGDLIPGLGQVAEIFVQQLRAGCGADVDAPVGRAETNDRGELGQSVIGQYLHHFGLVLG